MLDEGASIDYAFDDRRRGFLQVVQGEVDVGDELLHSGDAIAIVDQTDLRVEARGDSELLLFDMG